MQLVLFLLDKKKHTLKKYSKCKNFKTTDKEIAKD